MFIFVLQLREYLQGDPEQLYLFSLAAALVWATWLVKVLVSRRYSPWAADYQTTTAVVVPVVDEPEDLFRDVLRRITAQAPTEIVVVINGRRNVVLEQICAEFATVRSVWTPIAGKRNAVKVGVEHTTSQVVVLVDSDTIWTTDTLVELVKPFADHRVGGVTTRQRILSPERSWMTRWADWLENSRALYSMPTQSVLGHVGCLPGRTIAFRREILERCMHQFMTARFLGVFLEVSDDRTLTNYALQQGYRTVYQSTSLVLTDAPTRVGKLFRQQLRWARGSTYNTLRMLPWYLTHTPVLAYFFLIDILIPFILMGAAAGWVVRAVTGEGTNFYRPMLDAYPGWQGYVFIAVLIVVSSTLSMWVRQARHLSEVPRDLLRMPLFVVASTFFLMPIRVLGFLRQAHVASWGTRDGAYDGDDSAVDQPDDGPSERGQSVLRPAPAPWVEPLGSGGVVHSFDARGGVGGTKVVERLEYLSEVDLELDLDRDLGPDRDPDQDLGLDRDRDRATAPAAPRARRRRLNPLAGIPYVMAMALFALMVLTWI